MRSSIILTMDGKSWYQQPLTDKITFICKRLITSNNIKLRRQAPNPSRGGDGKPTDLKSQVVKEEQIQELAPEDGRVTLLEKPRGIENEKI